MTQQTITGADQAAIVVTTINPPTASMQALVEGSSQHGCRLFIIGDEKSPADFALPGSHYADLQAQRVTPYRYANACPVRHYARKNIGYLMAIAEGARVIIETDDDNTPLEGFWQRRDAQLECRPVPGPGWINIYQYFSDATIWPRGLPLDAIHDAAPSLDSTEARPVYCPIQQGLADGNPDVDAIYRLTLPLPQHFEHAPAVAIGPGSWCPFNSQNTTTFPDAFPLLYLPYYCSFRMTDIWRSFVAQVICHVNGWSIGFHAATMFQDRNEHDLMRDFQDEVPGYTHNRQIMDTLSTLPLKPGAEHIPDNLRLCYQSLIDLGLVGNEEMPLLDCWLEDIQTAGAAGAAETA